MTVPSLYRSQKYIKQPSHQTDRVCPVPQLPQSVPHLPQSLTPQTVSVLCHSYHSHSHHRLCPSCATATTVTHTTDCPSCATATTVTHTTDCVRLVPQLPQSLTPQTVHPVPQLPQSLTQQTASILCNSYHSHSHHTVTQQTTSLLFHGQNNDTSHSYRYTTDHVHPLYSHNHHSIILPHHRPCPCPLQPQSSFYHTATPQTMSILSTATIIILSYCYTTDHVHPLYSHSHHSVILLHHRPCPPFPNHNKHTKHPITDHFASYYLTHNNHHSHYDLWL